MAETGSFERAWARVQAGEPARAAVEEHGGVDDLTRLLKTAGALAALGDSMPVPPVAQSWEALEPMLEPPATAKVNGGDHPA